ncbi:MAG: hypothetical protein NT118_08400, partial [Lentisphaerae bacterium]|nr:hypothetical protein [Lentisphaerota bacterium]
NGGVAVMAHSLGNMLAIAAISLYGANVDTYFIIDGAVAKEAFNPGEAKENKGGMERMEWDDYCYEGTAAPDFLFSSEWFRLFAGDPNDPRGKLTWRGLFQDMNGATCYNFYSSGEEVLDNITHDKGNLTLIDDAVYGTGDISLYCWGSQEKLKGRMLMNGLVGSNYAGWGFNGYYYDLEMLHMSSSDAQNINPEQLKTKPFFCDSPSELFSQDAGTAQTYALNNRFAILAKAIPARSFAIGRNEINRIETGFESLDMMAMKSGPDKNWWPNTRDNDRWLHSDFKNVSYLYTFDVYNNIVSLGGLK